jgi:hypothetical protein
MNKKFLIGALVIATISLGFFRDYIFISINRSIESGVGGNLPVLKWILTFLFSLLYLLLSGLFLYLLFNSKKYITIAIVLYGVLFCISIIVALFGYFLSSFENTYHFIRTVMGVAQSPIVMMVLIAACYLDGKALAR